MIRRRLLESLIIVSDSHDTTEVNPNGCLDLVRESVSFDAYSKNNLEVKLYAGNLEKGKKYNISLTGTLVISQSRTVMSPQVTIKVKNGVFSKNVTIYSKSSAYNGTYNVVVNAYDLGTVKKADKEFISLTARYVKGTFTTLSVSVVES